MFTIEDAFEGNRDDNKRVKIKELDLKQFDLTSDNNNLNLEKFNGALPGEVKESVLKAVNSVKHSNSQVNEYATKCMEFIRAAEKGVDYLNEHRGFFSRIWGAITGKSYTTNLQNTQDVINAQKACVQMINEMNKQMLLTQEQILMLENLLHYMIKEENEFRRALKEHLKLIFDAVKKRFERIEKVIYDLASEVAVDRKEILNHDLMLKKINTTLTEYGIDLDMLKNKTDYLEQYLKKVERKVETVEWYIHLDSYDNEYEKEDSRIIKFLKAVYAFHQLKHAKYTFSDLLVLSSALNKLGFHVKETVTIESFISEFINDTSQNRYFERVHKSFDFEDSLSFLKDLKDEDESLFSGRTPFILVLNLLTFEMSHSQLHNEKLVNIKDIVVRFLSNTSLNIKTELDWFLLACEILSYLNFRKFGNFNTEAKLINNNLLILKNSGNSGLDEYIQNVILNPSVEKIKIQLNLSDNKSLQSFDLKGIKEFLTSGHYNQLRSELGRIGCEIPVYDIHTPIIIGLYCFNSSPNTNGVTFFSAVSILDSTNEEVKKNFTNRYDKVDIDNDYNSYCVRKIYIEDENNDFNVSNALSDDFVELLFNLLK